MNDKEYLKEVSKTFSEQPLVTQEDIVDDAWHGAILVNRDFAQNLAKNLLEIANRMK